MNLFKLKNIVFIFSAKIKLKFFFVIGLMLISAIAELVSIGLILPFLSLIIDSEGLNKYPILISFTKNFAFIGAPIIVVSFFLLVVNILSTLVKVFSQKIIINYSFEMGHELSYRMFELLLNRPYSILVGSNSSELTAGIVAKSNGIIYNVIMPLMLLFVSLFNLIAILFTLFLVDYKIAGATILTFGGSYFVINKISHKILLNNSNVISRTTTLIHQVVNESIGGIRDVILGNYQSYFQNKFEEVDSQSRKALSSNYILSTVPRFLLEGLAISIVCLIVMLTKQNLSSLVVTFGLLAMVAQRGLPALNTIYNSLSNIKGNDRIIDDVIEFLQPNLIEGIQHLNLDFNSLIEFKNVRFKYNLSSSKFNLEDICLSIVKGSNIGIVGKSGSGKSTFSDLLTGLLYPTSGRILVDGDELNFMNHLSWRKKIAYVPQSIFLIDGSFIDNIAFGLSDDLVDVNRVKFVAKIVGLNSYIEELVHGYYSFTGERGISLSGGQVQRIGIARALYKNPEILVLDEATSSLDSESEKFIIDSIIDFSKDLTLIMIAHRVTTLQHCDVLYEFESSKLVGRHTYTQYLEKQKNVNFS